MKLMHALAALAVLMVLTVSPLAQAAEAQPLAQDPVVEKRLNAISENLRCLVCQNESLAGSRADLAEDLRREVRNLILSGKSDQEIIEFLVARYGDYVLYDPPFKATTVLLWVGPFVVLAGGLVGLIVFLRRRSRAASSSKADEELVSMASMAPTDAAASRANTAPKASKAPRASAAPTVSSGRWLLWLLLVLIPLGAVGVYFKVGTPLALNPENLRPRPDPEVMVARLQAKMDANPNDPQGWILLGRAYMMLNRPVDAVKAYDHILPEVKQDPQLTAAYAEALAASGDIKRAQAWIDAAMKRGSNDPQILFLAGGLAFAQGDNAKAIRFWEQVLQRFPPGSDEAKFVQENINEANMRLKSRLK